MNYLNQTNQSQTISYKKLRRAVGIVGISIPFVLYFGNYWLGNCSVIQSSISYYYYTKMSYFLVGSICAISFFLLCYNGVQKIDSIVANWAAFFALGVAFFPTTFRGTLNTCVILQNNNPAYFGTLHNIFAVLFFITLACMSLFIFTLTNKNLPPSKQKLARNIIYKICGYLILGCIVAIGIIFIFFNNLSWQPVFILESVALIAFGISWLVKGEMFMGDK